MNDFIVKSVAFKSSLSNEEREVFHLLSNRLDNTHNRFYSIIDSIGYCELHLEKPVNMLNPSMICWLWAETADKLFNLCSVKQDKLDRILCYLKTLTLDAAYAVVLRGVLNIIIE